MKEMVSGSLILVRVEVSIVGDGVGSCGIDVIGVKPCVSLHVGLGESVSFGGADLAVIVFCGVGLIGIGSSVGAWCCGNCLGPKGWDP